jgi:hypothetical protein
LPTRDSADFRRLAERLHSILCKGMKFTADDEIGPYDLARLALLTRCGDPSEATHKAVNFLMLAETEIEGIALRAQAEAADASGEWAAEREKRNAQHLDSVRVTFKYILATIAGGEKGYALPKFKQFLEWEARNRGEKDVKLWAKATLNLYRRKKFTGTEAKRLTERYYHWENKGKQGRLKKPVSDGRLKAHKRKKVAKAFNEIILGEQPPTERQVRRIKPEIDYTSNIETVEAIQAAASTGKISRTQAA